MGKAMSALAGMSATEDPPPEGCQSANGRPKAAGQHKVALEPILRIPRYRMEGTLLVIRR